MTSISQITPTYSTGGISDQPDELKKPGQVRDCVNAIPDLIGGLSKRNGLEFIDKLSNNCGAGYVGKGGSWFHFTRESKALGVKENFIGKVSLSGKVQVWDATNGDEKAVYNLTKEINPKDAEEINIFEQGICEATPYLEHTKGNSLNFNSINDFTFITNPAVAVTMNKSTATRPYESFIEITQLAPSREYLLDVDLINSDETSSYRTVKDVSLVGTTNFGGDNKDDSCPANFIDTVTVDESYLNGDIVERDQQGLQLKIETTGVQSLINNDEGYECTYRHQIDLINGGRNWRKGDVVKIYQSGGNTSQGDADAAYYIEVTEVEVIRSSAEYQITGVTTANDGDNILSIKDVLKDMRSALIAQGPFTIDDIELVGNGLYITHDEPFTIATSEKDLMNILSNEDELLENPYVTVNNVSRLPIECKDGIIAKVSNAFTADDDYWVEFRGNYASQDGATGATGYWEEVAEPGGYTTFNAGTMPHALVYGTFNGETVFYLGPCEWDKRTCGTDEFNPSFKDYGINNVIYYRNRLVFLSQENLIMTRAGELFNLFPSTALTVSPLDPIDVSASTDFSSVLQDALIINNGLVVFSNYQQFLFTTDSDVLDPTTAKITEISRYEYNPDSSPFSIGTNIGFMGSSPNRSRFYELANVFREGPVDILERSKIVSKSIPPNLDRITQSKETGLVLAAAFNTKDIWCYRYFKESASNDLQSMWFRWTIPNNFVFHTIVNNIYYLVMENEDGECLLTRLTIDDNDGPWTDLWSEGNEGVPYEMRVDFPTVNVVKKETTSYQADTTSSLVVHRLNFNFADIGSYYFDIKRDGMDDYNVLYESRYMDKYLADATPTVPEVERTIPVYTRNTALDVTLRSDFPHPLILYSMRWEGDYNPRYYKRV